MKKVERVTSGKCGVWNADCKPCGKPAVVKITYGYNLTLRLCIDCYEDNPEPNEPPLDDLPKT